MGLKSAHSQQSDFFHESGEVDRFLKIGTHFQERSSCYMVRLLAIMSKVFVDFESSCSGANL